MNDRINKGNLGKSLLSNSDEGKRQIKIRIEETINGKKVRSNVWGFLHPEYWPKKEQAKSIGIGSMENGMEGPLYPKTAHYLIEQLIGIWIVNENGIEIPIYQE